MKQKETFIKIGYILFLMVILYYSYIYLCDKFDFFCNNSHGDEYYQIYGVFGDYVGGVFGTILTAITLVFVYLTYDSQRKELKLQRKLIAQQQFETTFFNMLNVHRELKNSLSINSNTSISYDHDGSLEKLISEFKKIENFTLFLIQEKINEGKKSGANVFEIISNDYKILFNEELIIKQIEFFKKLNKINLSEELEKHLEKLKDLKNKYCSFYNKFDKNESFNILFDPHKIDLSKLKDEDIKEILKVTSDFIKNSFILLDKKHNYINNHYCKNVFHILKYIYQNELSELKDLNDESKKEEIKSKFKNYADIFQSQLNIDEQFILFYYFIVFNDEDKKEFSTINICNHYKFFEDIDKENLIDTEHCRFYDFEIK